MGVIELLTLIGVALRLLGVIAWPWTVLLMPMAATVVFYIDWLMLQIFAYRRSRKERRRQ